MSSASLLLFALLTNALPQSAADDASGGSLVTPFVTSPLCRNPLDLIVVIDSSGSVQDVYDEIIDDVEVFLSNFPISNNETRVGIIDFSAVANVISPLDSNNNENELYSLLEKLRLHPQNGETWIELALDRATEVFAAATPIRNVRKVMVMYTDGLMTSNDWESLKDILKDQERRHISTFMVAVNNITNYNGLQALATSNMHIFHMKDTESMYQPKPTFVDSVCGAASSTSTPPTSSSATPGQTHDCQFYRDQALEMIKNKVPTFVPVWVPACNEDGSYAPVQHNNLTDEYWCVDRVTGVQIHGSSKTGSEPDCTKFVGLLSSTPSPLSSTPSTTAGKSDQRNPEICTAVDNNTITCLAAFPKYRFNPTTRKCEMFIYGGCLGGKNMFDSLQKCLDTCADYKLQPCQYEQQDATNLRNTGLGSVLYIPECNDDGTWRELQRSTDGSRSWCVDIQTGNKINGTETIVGTADCGGELSQVCGLPKVVGPCRAAIPRFFFNKLTQKCEPFLYGGCNGNGNNFLTKGDCEKECAVEKPKCLQNREASLASVQGKVLPGMFIPECDEQGMYKEIQVFGSTGESWCVDKDTGEEVEGTRRGPGLRATCPTLGGKSKCETHREAELDKLKQGIVGNFIPSCEPDGSYTLIQQHPSSRSAWCVETDTGEEIPSTRVVLPDQPVCPVKAIDAAVLKSTCTSAECRSLYYSHEKHETSKCEEERLQGMLRESRGQRGFYYPACSTDGSYKVIQRHGAISWCVDPRTGQYLLGTVERQAGREPVCPKTEPTTGKAKSKCESERERKIKETNGGSVIGAFIPQCEADGSYSEIQRHGSTGYSWCVNKETGEEIAGTRIRGTPVCPSAGKAKSKCESERERKIKETNGGSVVGAFIPECEADGSYSEIQRHGSTGYSWCVNKDTGEEIAGTRIRGRPVCPSAGPIKSKCQLERQKALGASSGGVRVVGSLVPECDSDGSYKDIQSSASTGHRWCVDKNTGEEIPGTRTRGTPICPKPWAPKLWFGNDVQFAGTNNTPSASVTPKEVESEVRELEAYERNCSVKLKRYGCYNDRGIIPRPFPVLVARDTSIDPSKPITPAVYKDFLTAFVCKCADEAKKNNFWSFGIQNFVECYSGPDEGRYDEDGEAASDRCVNAELKTCDKTKDERCAGKKGANFVYMIETPTHQQIQRIIYDKRSTKDEVRRGKLKRRGLHKRPTSGKGKRDRVNRNHH